MNHRYKHRHFYTFKRYFMYLVFYSVGGWILERIINLMFLGEWYDNSVLIGPYQPLYGFGVLLTILFIDNFGYKLKNVKDIYKETIFILAAIFFTALVEATTGWGFEYIFDQRLWDYGDFFPCSLRYICVIPTTLFGIISYLVVKYIHPTMYLHLERISNGLFYTIFTIFIIDVFFTLLTL